MSTNEHKKEKSHTFISTISCFLLHIRHPTPDAVLITAKANMLVKEAAARPPQTAQSFAVINVLKTKTANRPV